MKLGRAVNYFAIVFEQPDQLDIGFKAAFMKMGGCA